MKQRVRPHWLLTTICALLLIITADGHVGATNQLRRFFSGRAEVSGLLLLEVELTPPVSTPGDRLTLNVTVTNREPQTVTPRISLKIPDGLQLDLMQLPPGATFNVPDGILNWLPVVSGEGGQQHLTLPLLVESHELNEPQRQITAVLDHNGRSQTAVVDFWVGVEPQAMVRLSTAQAAVGQPVTLSAEVAGPGPFTYEWDLGDGRLLDVAEPTVVYPVVGTYQINLRTTNPLATTSTSLLITVVPRPMASFTVDDATPGVNQVVSFTNQSGGQRPLRYEWDFGDGITDTVASPLHLYQEPGEYTVRLVIENEVGRSEASQTLQVGLPPAIADLVLAAEATAGEPIYGQAFGDERITGFHWNMGDGQIYEGEQVQHTYGLPGTYWVVMSAVNEFGNLDVGRWIEVAPGANTWRAWLPVLPFTGGSAAEASGTTTGAALILDEALAMDPIEPVVLEQAPLPDSATATEKLFWYINEARRIHQLPPLSFSDILSQAAQEHTDDMATNRFTGHVGSDGSSPPGRLVRNGYRGGYGGEATYWGMDNPVHAVEFWVNSAPHRQIILNQYVTEVGIGYTADFRSPNVWYWTAEFGSPMLGAIVLTPTPIPSATPTLTPTIAVLNTVTATPSPTRGTVTPTGTPTVTSTPPPTLVPTYTPLPLITWTPTAAAPTATSTSVPTATPTATPTPTATWTPSP